MFSLGAAFDLVAFMHEHLGAVDPRLMWEFGPAVAGGRHRLVLTPETDRHLRPLTDAILAAAPSGTGFEFYSGRLAEPMDHAMATVQGRTGLSVEGWGLAVRATEALGLEFQVVPRREQLTSDRINEAAWVAVESLLGEAFLDPYCDDVTVSSEEAAAVPFASAAPEAHALLAGVRERGLPNAPLFEFGDSLKWTLFKLSPAKAEEYPSQLDLFVARTVHVPMWRRAHSGIFFSKRFSRFNETFCYLKLDGKDAALEGFADKAAIEDALAAAFAGTGLGAVIGGGTGFRYSYIDLALIDVEKSIPLLRETLQRGRVAKRSWLLFYDDELAAEWVGIWPDSPEPPGLPD